MTSRSTLQARPKPSLDTLQPLDAAIVRFIAGVMTDDLIARLIGPDGFAVRRRLAELMTKHSTCQPSDLVLMPPEQRRTLAESITLAELDVQVPGEINLAPKSTGIGSVVAAQKQGPESAIGLVRGRRYVKPTRCERERARTKDSARGR